MGSSKTGPSAALLCVNRITETVASNAQYAIPNAAALTERAKILLGRPARATPEPPDGMQPLDVDGARISAMGTIVHFPCAASERRNVCSEHMTQTEI